MIFVKVHGIWAVYRYRREKCFLFAGNCRGKKQSWRGQGNVMLCYRENVMLCYRENVMLCRQGNLILYEQGYLLIYGHGKSDAARSGRQSG